MSAKHLSAGSECPPKVEGKLRLYSMHFCPFAQRVRLVLNMKGVPYDIVNVNLRQKPDWIFKLHPEGKVPVLDTGDQVVTESLSISDYIDEKYPDPPLYPADPERKARDKDLIEKFGQVISSYSRSLFNKEKKPLESFMREVYEPLDEFENELASRGTIFFGGEKPGMLDLMIWPWGERSKLPGILMQEKSNFPKEKYPKLVAWRLAMQEIKAVKDTVIDQETHLKFFNSYLDGSPNAQFDDL